VRGGPPHVSRDASVTIQGFDPATGKTVWSFDAGRNIGLMSLLTIPPRLDQDTIVVGDGAQRVALNLRNGSHRPVSATAAAWCEGMILYRLSHTAYYGGKGGQYAGAGGLFACSADGHRRATPAKLPGLVRAVGATADGMTGWTDTNGTVRAQPSP
jgi:hypothetical protein